MSKPNRSFEPSPSRRAILAGGTAALLSLCALGPMRDARAQSARLLDAPRAAGTVGERYDGYAVPRGAVSPEIARLIDQVNGERRTVYAERAKNTGAPLEAVGKIYAQEILKSAPAGTWFLGENGQWTRK
ncbi:MAG TPA: YdbL family protein [Stellaceae bacterium]|nr:YdbL family protein [Stellaceae bacterium]